MWENKFNFPKGTCWKGYEPIGTKILDGREVPNCVPIKASFAQGDKISFDYDDTLSTERGKELAQRIINNGATLYIISARNEKEGMLKTAEDLGIPESRVYATGSNKMKVEKIKELSIIKHYDNNQDVIDELGTIGEKFGVIEEEDMMEKNAEELVKMLEELLKEMDKSL